MLKTAQNHGFLVKMQSFVLASLKMSQIYI